MVREPTDLVGHQLIAFHEYLSEDGTEVEYVQAHPDTDNEPRGSGATTHNDS